MWIVCSTRGGADGTSISERHVQWFMLCAFVICGISRSLLHTRGTEFDWQVGLVFPSVVVSWQQHFSFCFRDINDNFQRRNRIV